MQLLQGDAINELISECKREALHLELLDAYDNPEESAEFRRFLAGEPDDYAWMNGWAGFVRELGDRNVAMCRARVVTVPHTDWTRWGLEVAAVNVAAGEDVRYLPRHLIDPADIGVDDWWLLDDQLVIYTLFDSGGACMGAAATTDRHLVGRCREIWDRLWSKAVPHAEYHVTTPR
ncbi:hypothetical protein APR12_004831 [Nocardia amikacinitolerans]|uniref:DUF6879 family protein n=1 Tax=Nocardia amikacinitolerans TaxID=756689 RepID=UPI000836EEC0|nr:DUF6879 family protein [Nocardia amikacinitolerans]MCP2319463.1 hypothetical protein [Nocardia amikacinitolerans]